MREPPKTARTLLRKGKAISDLIKLETHNRTISNSGAAVAFRKRQQQIVSAHPAAHAGVQPMLIPRSDARTLLVAQPGTTAANVTLFQSELSRQQDQ